MTHPQDPEQQAKLTKHTMSCPHSNPLCADCKAELYAMYPDEQQERAAVEAYMRGMGATQDGATNGFWYIKDMGYIAPWQATFFYRTTQAQVAEARIEGRLSESRRIKAEIDFMFGDDSHKARGTQIFRIADNIMRRNKKYAASSTPRSLNRGQISDTSNEV